MALCVDEAVADPPFDASATFTPTVVGVGVRVGVDVAVGDSRKSESIKTTMDNENENLLISENNCVRFLAILETPFFAALSEALADGSLSKRVHAFKAHVYKREATN